MKKFIETKKDVDTLVSSWERRSAVVLAGGKSVIGRG